MIWQYTPLTIPLLLIAVCVTFLAIFIWRSPGTPIVQHASLLLFAGVFWLVGVTLELAGADLATKVLWNKIQYFGAVTVPLGWLLLILRMLGHSEWIRPHRVAILSVIPVFTLLAIWTNDSHRLVWTSHELRQTGSFSVLINGHGVIYWLYYGYASLLVTCAVILLIRTVARERELYRGQALTFLISGLVPLIVSTLDFARPDIFGGLNPVPLALIATVTAMVGGIVRFRSGDIVPIARKLVMESMADAVLVFDTTLRLVDMNGAAEKLLHIHEGAHLGRPINEIWSEMSDHIGPPAAPFDQALSRILESQNKDRTLDVRTSTLTDWRRQTIGSVVVARDITEQTLNSKRLQTSLREKEVLLKEIHHRVKNNLQIITSLLSLQSNTIDNPLILGQFQDSQNRIRSMSLIHERLYQSDNLANIEFGAYLRDLTGFLVQSYRAQSEGVTLRIDGDELYLSIDTAIPCGLVVNELVSNSLKHAFPNGRVGEIRIAMNCHSNGKYQLKVCDNGVGMPSDISFQNTTSLGLQLVNSLIGQLGGKLELTQTSGTMFVIEFPSAVAARA